MASNLTIESPNFEKISKEAGQFTMDAINLLWAALNDTRKNERIDFRMAKEIVAPKVLNIAQTANMDNLDLQGCSVLSFSGTSSVNLTGLRAPDTGDTRMVIIQVNGTGTITVKHNVTSETANQFFNKASADVTLATNAAGIWLYLSPKWRQIA